MTSRNANPYAPPARVMSMIVMLTIMTSGLFWLMTGSWLVGAVLGLAFAGAFYVVVVNARKTVSKTKRRRR